MIKRCKQCETVNAIRNDYCIECGSKLPKAIEPGQGLAPTKLQQIGILLNSRGGLVLFASSGILCLFNFIPVSSSDGLGLVVLGLVALAGLLYLSNVLISSI